MANTHDKASARAKIIPDIWCHCDGGPDDPFYAPDHWCQCGIEKHHWHCQQCKRLAQIG